MKIIEIPPSDASRLVPLLKDLHALHVAHQPARHTSNPEHYELEAWLTEWLASEGLYALGAESPQGALLGYLIYQIEHREALPVRAAETRAMLHHIAVQEPWQRMGVGKALMVRMKANVRAMDISIITTSYAPFNDASAALMTGMGLQPVLTVAEWRA
ncbi:GNAT family N-acetyltransferase [Parasedimentitalea marina]|uniref:GNAT family N-acetyltransferase n=1 Tax=Parasedimentitalea marina TaxID=2483033 RepID=A0A3T0N4C2_9RHOB|nr:GNAT family N-acetyltransferase [Parasedimentitalea marina]AZV78880.1 GNAT family N-acetyltransferase [Parasedimentitalea marina]